MAIVGDVTYTHSSLISATKDEVFEWHTRAGAISRLLPPTLRIDVLRDPESLRDGESLMRLHGLLPWRARQIPELFEPARSFGSDIALAWADKPVRWRHTHLFEEVGNGRTQVTDHAETNVPASALRPFLHYRQRQLATELAALHRSSKFDDAQMVIGVTGSSGLVGSGLCALLTTSGHRVVRLVRREPRTADERRWDPLAPAPDLLEGLDAVVHLAGEPILGRFTTGHKQRVRDSRVAPTRALAELAARSGLGVFVSASGLGNYPDGRGSPLPEESAGPGKGFLADVIADWEAATGPAAAAGVRTVQVRTGIALSPRGGVLGLMAPMFRLGVGGRLGSGRQRMAWIALDDLLDIYRRAVLDPQLEGPVNALTPETVSNSEFTRTLGHVLKRPTVARVPESAASLVLKRDGVTEFMLANQRTFPGKLVDAGHVYRYPRLESALRHMLNRAPEV